MTDFSLLVKGGLRQHNVTLQRGFAHIEFTGNRQVQMLKHFEHAVSVGVAHDRVGRVDEQTLDEIWIAVNDRIGKFRIRQVRRQRIAHRRMQRILLRRSFCFIRDHHRQPERRPVFQVQVARFIDFATDCVECVAGAPGIGAVRVIAGPLEYGGHGWFDRGEFARQTFDRSGADAANRLCPLWRVAIFQQM